MGTASSTSRGFMRVPRQDDRLQPTSAAVGDHAAIEHFLAVVLQRPTPQEFQAQLEDPFYEPTDRLLVKDGSQIVGHVRQTWRTMSYGAARWPFCRLSYLAALPEYGGSQVTQRLIDLAETHCEASGALIVEMDETDQVPGQRPGWVRCWPHVFSQASPLDIFAQLSDRKDQAQDGQLLANPRRRPRLLSVRYWRHVELPALMRIYEANLPNLYGALERSETYWRWLISRRAFDQIFVAIEGRDRLSLEEDGCRIVGYAVTKGRHILELMIEPEHPTAASQLLDRACADAIERDEHTVRLHAPPDDPLHDIVRDAGGKLDRNASGARLAVKLLQPLALVEQLTGELLGRALNAGVRLPLELGMQVGGSRWQLAIDRTGSKVIANKLGRSYLSCDAETCTRLLLGYEGADSALAAGRLEASTALATELAATLFPRMPLWRPPWDHLAS